MATPPKLGTLLLGTTLLLSAALGQSSCAVTSGGDEGAIGGAGSDTAQGGQPDFQKPPGIALPPAAGTGGGASVEPVHAVHVLHGVPTNLRDKFDSLQSDDASGLKVHYPESETMFPPNIERILFQWKSSEQKYFHLKFSSESSSLDIYTDGLEAACEDAGPDVKCYQATAETFQPFGKAVAASTVNVELESLDASMTKVLVGQKTKLHFAPTPISGAIYYWSTNSQGIRRTTLNAEVPYDYLVPANFATKANASGECVACHTLSRSGKYLAFAFPGDRLGIVEVTEEVPPVLLAPPGIAPGNAFVAASWSSFNPDDTSLVVSGEGKLNIVAREGGASQGTIALPANHFAAMPDWSPDGKTIAFAMHDNPDIAKRTRHLTHSRISFVSSSDGTAFSALKTAVSPTTSTETLAYPMFSPDGKWLAYSRANVSSEEDASSEIRIARIEENAETFSLPRANTLVHGTSTSGAFMNNMPTWAPTGDSSIAFIAFSTKREFGFLATGIQQHKQLWVAAVDLSKLGDGDASFPAFRIEGQDLDENNHRPFWALDVLPPDWTPPPPPIIK